MKISFHILKDQIEILIILSSDNLAQLDYVWMLKLLEQDDLAICSLGIGWMLEGIEYFF